MRMEYAKATYFWKVNNLPRFARITVRNPIIKKYPIPKTKILANIIIN
jgi:hypothetical protein